MNNEEVIELRVTRRNAGRIMNGLRERHRKLKKGVTKFGDQFDPEKGKNMVEGLAAYDNLISDLEGQIHNG